MLQVLTAKSNNTVILPLLIRDGMSIPGTIGLPGPRGKPGPIGPKGARGDRGIIGVRGEKGDKGSIGQKGAKGEHGTKGAKGESISEPQIVIPPGDQKVLEKSTATFSCNGVGNPIPKVKIMPTNKTVDSRYKKIGEGMLQITNVTAKDEGEIQCIAKSVLGEDRRKAKLTVLGKFLLICSKHSVLLIHGEYLPFMLFALFVWHVVHVVFTCARACMRPRCKMCVCLRTSD